jgi:hypothetical protein
MADLVARHEGTTHGVENIEAKAAPHCWAAPQPAPTPQVLHACAPAMPLLSMRSASFGFAFHCEPPELLSHSRCNRSVAIGLFTSVQPPPQPQPQPSGESSAKAILWKAILGKATDMMAATKHAETKVDAKRTIYRPRSPARPFDGSASLKLGNRGYGLRDNLANLRDTYDLMYAPEVWSATDERNVNLAVESAEVSKLVPSRTARHSVMPRYKCHHRRLVGACETEWAGACDHVCACRSAVRPTASGPSRA